MTTRTIHNRQYDIISTHLIQPNTIKYLQRVETLRGQRGALFGYVIRRDGSWYLANQNGRIIAQGSTLEEWAERNV